MAIIVVRNFFNYLRKILQRFVSLKTVDNIAHIEERSIGKKGFSVEVESKRTHCLVPRSLAAAPYTLVVDGVVSSLISTA